MANISDLSRNQWMLTGPLAEKGYDWWWHSFTAINRQTGEKKPFYIEFFTCNPAHAADEPVIVWHNAAERQNGKRPSYLMVNVGFWGREHGQLHRFFPWKDVTIRQGEPFMVAAGDCYLGEGYTKGTVSVSEKEAKTHPEWMSDAGEMSWKLKINKQVAYNVGYGASRFFRKLNAFEMFWHAEGMKTAYSGWVKLNGEMYDVTPETCYGYADKNWGGDFTSPWVWLSSNHLVSELTGRKLDNSVFNIGGGRPKIGPVALNRKLLGAFWYEGKNYEFNFSKFWTFSRTEFECREVKGYIRWHVVQKTLTTKLVTDVVCRKEDMLLINYEAPDGTKRHNRLWNGGNGNGRLRLYAKSLFGKYKLVDVIRAYNIGCEFGEYGEDNER